MTADPVWFGPTSRPLFGWLHLPLSRTARGGVVLCPTLAVEAMSAHRAYRSLATALEAAGYAVLRFDYDGTGDSAGGLDDPERTEAWLGSIAQAIALLRSTGVERVGVVGLRIGGTLAAVASARDGDIDALVLWDPVATGRQFVREQVALKHLSIGETVTIGGVGSAELLGMLLPAPLVEELDELDMTGLPGPLAGQVLMLARSDRPVNRRLRARLSLEACEWGEAVGQAELVDVLPDNAVLPVEALAGMAAWLERSLDGEPTTMTPVAVTSATVAVDPGGQPIREHAIRMGPHGLFGILTDGDSTTPGPAVIFLNAGLLHHVGPARVWVELARRWAGYGFRVLRIDLSGLGDSEVRPGQLTQAAYPIQALEDIAMAAEAISPQDPANVILAGLCAGAYHAIEAGIVLQTRGACLVNPILSFDPADFAPGGVPRDPRHAAQPYNRLFRRLRQHQALVRWGEKHVPSHLWWVLDKFNLQASPGRGLASLADAGVNSILVCGDVEALPFRQRARWTMRRLTRGSGFRFEVMASIDHTLFGASARTRTMELLTEHVVSEFATVDIDRQPVGVQA
jgi:pimeloyl-ACP methyl ester carboxylesterase